MKIQEMRSGLVHFPKKPDVERRENFFESLAAADMVTSAEGPSVLDEWRGMELLARGGIYADLHRLQFKD